MIASKHKLENFHIIIDYNKVQSYGKTRDVLSLGKDLNEAEINKLIVESSKANKHLLNKKIIKTIFVKNKIINYIVKN